MTSTELSADYSNPRKPNQGEITEAVQTSWRSRLMMVTGALLLAACAAAERGQPTPPRVGADLSLDFIGEALVEVIAEDLFTPWGVDFAPDGRMFFTERPGRIRIVKAGRLIREPWITLDDVSQKLASGLFGLAVHPQFAENRFIYVAYTHLKPDGEVRDRLVRLREQPDGKGTLDRVLLEHGLPGGEHHHGGCVKFGPDGKLYWTTGDLKQPAISQDLSHLAGKILRLNPDGTIPSDNPFPGSPIYSYGHRNPQGLAWQPGTGRLYAVEHGSSHRDELNYIQAGKNYGWPEIEGDETRPGMIAPALHSGDDETWAPAGATFVTQGSLMGSVLFTGLHGASIYRVALSPTDPGKVVGLQRLLAKKYGRLRALAEGPDGAIYFGTSNGDGLGPNDAGKEKLLRLSLP